MYVHVSKSPPSWIWNTSDEYEFEVCPLKISHTEIFLRGLIKFEIYPNQEAYQLYISKLSSVFWDFKKLFCWYVSSISV